MIEIPRDRYLEQLIARKDNGLVKVITGIRRCGKSFLLFKLYDAYLRSIGVSDGQIVRIALDGIENARLRNPLLLDEHIRKIAGETDKRLYVFLDEIQNVSSIDNPWVEGEKIGFVDVLLGLMKLDNIDLYVTGSNSRMLSNDIVTQFRDRGDVVRLRPLTFSEFYRAYDGAFDDAWRDFSMYGGLPRVLQLAGHQAKASYLEDLLENTYRRDVVERNIIRNDADVLGDLLSILASSIGSLTNPSRLANTFESVKKRRIDAQTVDAYIGYFADAFLVERAYRFDVRGKRYIETPLKYYFEDVGLRNARLGFRQQDENHIMENVVFNELKARGYSVDVGSIERRARDESGKEVRTRLEVDFVANLAGKIHYVQVAQGIDDAGKREQEIASLLHINDSFQKTVIVRGNIAPWYDEHGIRYMGLKDFLLDEDSLDS